MNDDAAEEVLGAVRAAVPGVSSHTPVQHVMSVARIRRRRRGLARLVGSGLAATVALTLGITATSADRAPPRRQPSHKPATHCQRFALCARERPLHR
jgi:hypothetical protein